MKSKIIAALCACVGLSAFQTGFASQVERQLDVDPRVSAGFELAPESLRVKGRNVSLVGLGSYIVNGTRGCNDCHDAAPASHSSFRQFRNAIRSGGGAEAPAAPAHAELSDLELQAIYEYLRAAAAFTPAAN